MFLKTVLLVEELDSRRIAIKWLLAIYGYIVETVSNAEEALAVFDPAIHDIVVTDQIMSGMTGTELAHIIKLRSPRTPVVLHSKTPPDNSSSIDSVLVKSDDVLVEEHVMALKVTLDRLSFAPAIHKRQPRAQKTAS